MKKIITAVVLFISCGVFAQNSDSTKKSNWNLTGSVDAYYRYNFNNAKDSGYLNNLTSFTNSHNSFELGMASLKVDHSIGKVSATIDLGVGRRAEEFSYNDQGVRTAIKQAYLTYAPSGKVKFTMGKWATHVGYELADAYLNRNYGMAYMFSYGPFFHTGIKADITLGNFGIMAGVANPTDYFTASFAKKNLIAQLSGATKNGKLKGYLNYVGGKDLNDNNINQGDLVIIATITDKFNVGYNGTIKSVKSDGADAQSWWGSALYLNVDPTSIFGLTLRGEYFDDKKEVAGLSTGIFDATLSANIRIDNLTIIPEFRVDNAKDEIFFKNSGESIKNTGSFILAATYHF